MFQKGLLGTLSKDVFERRTSTGSEAFSLSICLDANKLVLLSFFSLLKTIYPRVSTKPLPNDAKSPLLVDVRRSKTLLLKLPIIGHWLENYGGLSLAVTWQVIMYEQWSYMEVQLCLFCLKESIWNNIKILKTHFGYSGNYYMLLMFLL